MRRCNGLNFDKIAATSTSVVSASALAMEDAKTYPFRVKARPLVPNELRLDTTGQTVEQTVEAVIDLIKHY